MPDQRYIVTFSSTHLALSAERAAKKAGIPVKMVPVPRKISPDCTMGMTASAQDKQTLKTLMTEKKVEHKFMDWKKE